MRVDPLCFRASQSGGQTLDDGEGGGNPFASALVELLGRQSLTLEAFRTELVKLTRRKSAGFQSPDITGGLGLTGWQFLPGPSSERRVALVMVFSDYSASAVAPSLPGAEHDMHRIALALEVAGFEVEKVLDPDRTRRGVALGEFAARSAAAEAAVLYTTGHGAEIDGAVYLLPGDYPFSQGRAALTTGAVSLAAMGSALQASRANLLFYGGCRNDPFGPP